MRNLIHVSCKRYLFRWETFAVTLLNLLLTILCTVASTPLSEAGDPDGGGHQAFYMIIFVISLVSLCLTMAAVIFTEVNTLATGAIRNLLIAGYRKEQIFLSKYIAVGIFSIVQGMLFLLPPVLVSITVNKWIDHPVYYMVSMLLMYAAVSCMTMTVCLLTDRPAMYVALCICCFFALLYGGNSISSSLDISQYSSVEVREDGIIKTEDPWYVPSPKRDILEQCIMISPVQPILEYGNWYSESMWATADGIRAWEGMLSRADNEGDAEYCRWNLQEINRILQTHTNRVKRFPIYQTAFIVVFGLGSMVIFKKRDLK